jgi:hypothetical protein
MDGVLVDKTTGQRVTSPRYNGKIQRVDLLIKILTPKPERQHMTIFQAAGFYHLKSKTNDVHATRYRTREQAAEAARKISAGLTHWQSISKRIVQLNNYSNAL